MKCRDCPKSFIGTSDGDKQMAKQGYKSCGAAKNAEERGMYVRGETECMWPERVKK